MHLINKLIGMYRMALDKYEYSIESEIEEIYVDLTALKFHEVMDEAYANDICVFTKINKSSGLKIFDTSGIPISCAELTEQDISNDPIPDYRIKSKYTLQ